MFTNNAQLGREAVLLTTEQPIFLAMRAGNLDHATRILLGCLQQHQAARQVFLVCRHSCTPCVCLPRGSRMLTVQVLRRDDAASAVVVEQADAANAHRSTAASAVVHAAVCSATAQHIKQQTCQLCRQGSLSDLHQVYHRTQQLIQPLPWAVGVMHSQSSLMQGLNVHMQMGHRLIATSQCLHSRRHPASLAAAAHQPAKHVPGTDPLKLLKAANAAATAGRGAVAAAAVNNTAAAQAAAITVKEPWHVRFKAGAQAWLSKAKTALPHLALVLFVCVTGSLSRKFMVWGQACCTCAEATSGSGAGQHIACQPHFTAVACCCTHIYR